VVFLQELQAAIANEPIHYVVSFTVPTSYWYLRWFDLTAVQYVDWINVMSYDLHGTWVSMLSNASCTYFWLTVSSYRMLSTLSGTMF